MPRCDNWPKLNAAYKPPAGRDHHKVEEYTCWVCWKKGDPPLFVFIEAPYLGPKRAMIVCNSCAERAI